MSSACVKWDDVQCRKQVPIVVSHGIDSAGPQGATGFNVIEGDGVGFDILMAAHPPCLERQTTAW